MRQRSAAGVIHYQCEVDVGVRRAEGGIGRFGNGDFRLGCLHNCSIIIRNIAAGFRLTLHIHAIGQGFSPGNRTVDTGFNP